MQWATRGVMLCKGEGEGGCGEWVCVVLSPGAVGEEQVGWLGGPDMQVGLRSRTAIGERGVSEEGVREGEREVSVQSEVGCKSEGEVGAGMGLRMGMMRVAGCGWLGAGGWVRVAG